MRDRPVLFVSFLIKLFLSVTSISFLVFFRNVLETSNSRSLLRRVQNGNSRPALSPFDFPKVKCDSGGRSEVPVGRRRPAVRICASETARTDVRPIRRDFVHISWLNKPWTCFEHYTLSMQ